MAEGYERQQAIAMAFSMCGQKAMNLDESEDKCPGDDCDCGGGEKPRPKAFRRRLTLDGATTEAIVKAWDRWNVIVKDQPDDCGTGAGGFKEGNVCATGESAGGADGEGIPNAIMSNGVWYQGRNFDESDQEFIKQLRERRAKNGMSVFYQMDSDDKRAIVSRMGEMTQEGAVKFMVGLMGPEESKQGLWSGTNFTDDDNWALISTYQTLEAISNSAVMENYFGGDFDPRLPMGVSGLLSSLAHHLDIPGGMQNTAFVTQMSNLIVGSSAVASDRVSNVLDLAEEYVDKKAILPTTEAVHTALGGEPFVAKYDAVEYHNLAYNETGKALLAAAHKAAVNRWKKMANESELSEFNGYKMTPKEMLASAVDEANAWNHYFAKQGLSVRVDPGVFMGKMIDGNPSNVSPASVQIGHLTHAYNDLIGMARGLQVIKDSDAGDIQFANISVVRRDHSMQKVRWAESATAGGDGAGAWWRNSKAQLTIPVDRWTDGSVYDGEQGARMRREFSQTEQWSEMGTFIHEMGHAFHSRNTRSLGATYLQQTVNTHATKWLTKENWKGTGTWDETRTSSALEMWTRKTADRISKYGGSKPVEFVAETFTLKTLEPEKWDFIKKQQVFTVEEAAQLPQYRFREVDMTPEQIASMTYGELYELLGGQ
jgi:hypothetical protein